MKWKSCCTPQNPTETQLLVAHVLGIDSNKIVVRVKRLSGVSVERTDPCFELLSAVAAKEIAMPINGMLSRRRYVYWNQTSILRRIQSRILWKTGKLFSLGNGFILQR
jgi:xanthine dehydrogenase molybdopterin-binding subunit B